MARADDRSQRDACRCVQSGCRRAPVPGQTRCPVHAAAQRAYTRASRARIPPGRCRQCRRPVAAGSTYCRTHLLEHRERSRIRIADRYWARRAAGLCVSCGRPARPGRSMCPRHAAAKTRQMADRRRGG